MRSLTALAFLVALACSGDSGPDVRTCASDADCVVVPAGCCECDGLKAFHRANAEAHRPTDCERTPCPPIACPPVTATASCKTGKCTLEIKHR